MEGTPAESAKDSVSGPIGVAIGYDDPALLAKKVLSFVKKNTKLEIKQGVIEGRTCAISEIKTISELPSREVLLSSLAGTMQAPASKLASALSATLTRFVYLMDAIKNKKSTE